MYQPRTYRHWIKNDDLVSFNVVIRETDLYVSAQINLETETREAAIKHRKPLEEYISHHPLFLHALEPCMVEESAPDIVKEMARAAKIAGVGPMAAVAGAIAEFVGKDLLVHSAEIIVENGGDIFVRLLRKRLIGVYAGESRFTGKVALEIHPEQTPLGICASSGTVGHSLSLGSADAVIVLSGSTPLADASATAIGNKVTAASDLDVMIEQVKTVPELKGAVIIKDEKMAVWGDVRLVSV